MAGVEGPREVSTRHQEPGVLVAIDGVNGAGVEAAARALAKEHRKQKAAVSAWDASGIFGELMMAEEEAGQPSARTLLLLYAADLAFRLRWEVKPALAEGRLVVVAPYVNTAIAFGRAAGLDSHSLTEMFSFAQKPDETRIVETVGSRSLSDRTGFVEIACDQLLGARSKAVKRELIIRAARTLKTISALKSRPAKKR